LSLIPRNSLLASGFVNYLSSENEEVRETTISKWKSGVKSANFSFSRFLSSESEMLRWKAEGLPGDSLTMENAISMFYAPRTPLLVDPAT